MTSKKGSPTWVLAKKKKLRISLSRCWIGVWTPEMTSGRSPDIVDRWKKKSSVSLSRFNMGDWGHLPPPPSYPGSSRKWGSTSDPIWSPWWRSRKTCFGWRHWRIGRWNRDSLSCQTGNSWDQWRHRSSKCGSFGVYRRISTGSRLKCLLGLPVPISDGR